MNKINIKKDKSYDDILNILTEKINCLPKKNNKGRQIF